MMSVAGRVEEFALRPAVAADIPALETLIARSARGLAAGFYAPREIEAAIAHVFGVDSDLVADGTYFLATLPGGGLAGCGGWSRRRTLFGGDRYAGRVEGQLDPTTEPARIRAFFVAPEAARRGVATRLLRACEAAATAEGFAAAALMATLPGVPFYAAHGYQPGAAIELLCGGIAVRFVPMDKHL